MNNWQARIILLLIVGLGGILSLKYTSGHFKSDRQIILLDTTRPDFSKFLRVNQDPTIVVSKHNLKEYFDYFKLVTEAMPDNSQGELMLGYLHEITGDRQGARLLLEKAQQLDGAFFFTDFNLAVVFFEQGDYTKSTDLLHQALVIPPQRTLQEMMSSIIYRQFFSSMKDSHEIINGLQQAYQDAYTLLLKSSARQQGVQDENADTQIHAQII